MKFRLLRHPHTDDGTTAMTRTHTHRPRAIRTVAAGAIAFCAITTLSGVPASAASPTLTGVLSGGSLRLAWEAVDGSEAYLVVDERTGEVLWRGPDLGYTQAVGTDESRSLLVFADVGRTATTIGKALAMVPAEGSALPATAAVTTASQTTLSWSSSLPVESWEVTGEGVPSLSVQGSSVELPLGLESEIPVELSGHTVVDGEATELISGVALAEPRVAGSDVGGDAATGDMIAASTPVTNSTQVVYETYIPYQYINAPDAGSPFDCESGDGSDYWYSGDNRDFAFDSGKYRTRASATYAWIPAVTYTAKGVSPTNRYIRTSSGAMVYESSRTASKDGLIMEPMSNDGRRGQLHIAHSVGQPYCSATNNIDYFIMEDVYQNGSYYFSGNHDQMPNHQLVMFSNLSDGSRVSRLIFHHELVDAKCLSMFYPFCSKREYQYSR
jgi:hypothetical protein